MVCQGLILYQQNGNCLTPTTSMRAVQHASLNIKEAEFSTGDIA